MDKIQGSYMVWITLCGYMVVKLIFMKTLAASLSMGELRAGDSDSLSF